MKSIYLERYAWPEKTLTSYQDFAETGIVVVIPAYKEQKLETTLSSLNACYTPEKEVLVIVVINEPENTPQEIHRVNQEAYDIATNFKVWFKIKAVHLQLPKKKAGVGLARKIGMDEAIRIFNTYNRNGIIICFDADCTCDENYFVAIEEFYRDQSKNLGLVYYEHPLNGEHPSEIINYELFLRYYIHALRFAGYPNAIHTLGSCITIRSEAYEKQGGMNTRKAGEDFYFIHKMVPLGGLGEINTTCVYPSDRTSDRVPFGTGHAITKLLQQNSDHKTYNPATFQDLQSVFSSCQDLFKGEKIESLNLPESILAFYQQKFFEKDLQKILNQSNTLQSFMKRFFAWWDGFRILKFVHFSRDHYHPNIQVDEAIDWLIQTRFKLPPQKSSLKDKLLLLRSRDNDSAFYVK